jgi:HPt (histidine-containing phosphotransfer) domain-containing protein
MAQADAEELVTETVETYLEEAPHKLEAMINAAGLGDCQAIAEAAHALRSSSGAVFAKPLALLLQQLEEACTIGNMQAVHERLGSVRAEFQRVVEFLKSQSR